MYHRRRFPTVSPPKKLFRVGYGENPTALRPWDSVDTSRPPQGRFDDPEREYRVLYTSSTPEGAYREALQEFRPSNDLLNMLKEVEQNDSDYPLDDFSDFGVLPISWMRDHRFVEMTIDDHCEMVKVTDGAALDLIQIKLGYRLDASAVLSADRDITQQISRLVYTADERFAGIVAESKLGTDFANFALFEDVNIDGALRATVQAVTVQDINFQDPTLVDVANAYSLKIPGYEENAKRLKQINKGDCNFDELVAHVDAALAKQYRHEKPVVVRVVVTEEKARATWLGADDDYACMESKGTEVELTGHRKAPQSGRCQRRARKRGSPNLTLSRATFRQTGCSRKRSLMKLDTT